MPTVDFWLDWTIRAIVNQVRMILTTIGKEFHFDVTEDISVVSSPEGAMFSVRADQGREPVATIRTQTATAITSQMVLGPGLDTSESGLASLNRAGLVIYTQFILRGILVPPPPFEPPTPPFD